jgi:rare lipoprotein A (peptidoglycan hydrolase)
MQRWLIVLSLALVQHPDLAEASTRSPDVPLWKKVLSVFTAAPAARPEHRQQARPAKGVDAPDFAETLVASPVHGTQTRSTETDARCKGGQRIISAYYWEGQRTASGQPFNPHGMTAAHRTLPFGTRLTVTNPRTGKSVVVVVNDRGPFVSGVGLDLSLGAAQAIGLRGTGAICVSS